ncbi:MAG: hypothetical protein Q8O88_03395 [bacterium]|nr:hypothetical protein [bacterium]
MEKFKTPKIEEVVKNIPSIAYKQKWQISLDKEDGILYYSPKKIPDNTRLFQVTDEFALFLDKKNSPHGVMVECYAHNFMKHHLELKNLSKEINLFSKNEDDEIVIKMNKKDKNVQLFRELFEKTIISESLVGPLHTNR